MEKRYYDLIVKLIKEHRKYAGNENLLDEMVEEVYRHADIILSSVKNDDVVESFIKKVIPTAIITILKNNNTNIRVSKHDVEEIISQKSYRDSLLEEVAISEPVEEEPIINETPIDEPIAQEPVKDIVQPRESVDKTLVDKMINGIQETPQSEPVVESEPDIVTLSEEPAETEVLANEVADISSMDLEIEEELEQDLIQESTLEEPEVEVEVETEAVAEVEAEPAVEELAVFEEPTLISEEVIEETLEEEVVDLVETPIIQENISEEAIEINDDVEDLETAEDVPTPAMAIEETEEIIEEDIVELGSFSEEITEQPELEEYGADIEPLQQDETEEVMLDTTLTEPALTEDFVSEVETLQEQEISLDSTHIEDTLPEEIDTTLEPVAELEPAVELVEPETEEVLATEEFEPIEQAEDLNISETNPEDYTFASANETDDLFNSSEGNEFLDIQEQADLPELELQEEIILEEPISVLEPLPFETDEMDVSMELEEVSSLEPIGETTASINHTVPTYEFINLDNEEDIEETYQLDDYCKDITDIAKSSPNKNIVEICNLKYNENKTISEIAMQLGIGEDTVIEALEEIVDVIKD